jgi:hypothetical protein
MMSAAHAEFLCRSSFCGRGVIRHLHTCVWALGSASPALALSETTSWPCYERAGELLISVREVGALLVRRLSRAEAEGMISDMHGSTKLRQPTQFPGQTSQLHHIDFFPACVTRSKPKSELSTHPPVVPRLFFVRPRADDAVWTCSRVFVAKTTSSDIN